MLRKLIESMTYGCLLAALTALFHYFGGFHFEPALLLGGGFGLTATWLWELRAAAFHKPHQIIIGVDYAPLWEDLNLRHADGPTFENYTFTAITSALYTTSDARGYSTKLNLYAQVPCGAPAWVPEPGELYDRPTFFFEPGPDGYRFGVRVQDAWWQRQRSNVAPALAAQLPPPSYDNAIILGLLPYGFVPEHVRRWNEPISFWYPFERKQRQWKARLEKFGWKIDEDHPEFLRHRYVAVRYRDL